MGWLWGSSSSPQSTKSSEQDPLRNLDPELREFLKKATPTHSSSEPSTSAPVAHDVTNFNDSRSGLKDESSVATGSSDSSGVPRESLYQDGRYAHLWKSYVPQKDVESALKSDQEKMMDILEGYKTRKAEIGRASLENCALEQWQVNECFRNGDITSRMTLCRNENRDLERCYTMQAKFLRALGYVSQYERPAEVDEKIQMHADRLYHRMLDQEAVIEAAKAEGRPVPSFPPLLPNSKEAQLNSVTESEHRVHMADSETAQKTADEPGKILSEEDRLLANLATEAEIESKKDTLGMFDKYLEQQAAEKQQRKEKGQETIGDKISSIFGR